MTKTTIIIPHTEETFQRYYDLRYRVLREPFHRPRGSEYDEYDSVSEHRMLVDEDDGRVIGVGRVHYNSPEEAQIRFMAIDPDYQGQGHGVALIYALEKVALQQNAKRIIVNSRDNTVGFYERCGYLLTEEANTVDNPLAEHQLVKRLDHSNYIVYRPDWCEDLQRVWHEGIPISKAMGIHIYQYTGRMFEVHAPLASNINVHNTMFAGSIYTLATLTGWGMVQLQLQETGMQGSIVLGKADIEYKKPLKDNPRAVCNLLDVEGHFESLKTGKNAKLKLTVAVYDGDDFVALFTGVYFVLPEVEKTENNNR